MLHDEGADGESALEAVRAEGARRGLEVAAEAAVPARFGDLGVLLAERQVGLLRTDLSASAVESAEAALGRLPPDIIAALLGIEDFYLEAALRFADAGVSVVVPTVGWADVRRLMRAAEAVGWYPMWLTNDSQPVSQVLTETPQRQAVNLLHASSDRAAGDEISPIDRGCVQLRNTTSAAEHFDHRIHSDAWNLLHRTCDMLDVLFGAIARIDGPLERQALVASLAATDYEASHGSRTVFSDDDRFGTDRLRLLEPDPGCVLNEWGCMRAVSPWWSLATGARPG